MGRPRTPAGRARETNRRLTLEYPDARCELDHRNAYELLTATILSAQTTDVRVNLVTPALFARYPTPADLAEADPAEVEELIRSTGFFNNKTKSIIGMAQALVERFDGEVPGRDGGPDLAPRRRPQDRQRGAQRGARAARTAGRHPRRSAVPPARADRRRPIR